jgi:hypothetical protein
MHIGIQLRAPEGLGSLRKDTDYYFVNNSGGCATFAWFFNNKSGERRVQWTRLPQSVFEAALLDGSLVPTNEVRSLPPWLSDLEGKNITQIDSKRSLDDEHKRRNKKVNGNEKKKKSLREIVDERYAHIHGLVKRSAEVWTADNPLSEIGKHARGCAPPQNMCRLATWFVAYEICGRNCWALLPPFQNIGGWDRPTHASNTKKLGRPPLYAGAQAGHSAVLQTKKIEDCYVRHARAGQTMSRIYRKSMAEDFGCRTSVGPDGVERFHHPKGEPFPTNGQFRYYVFKRFGLEQVQRALYGEARMRAKSRTSQGRFSEIRSNILEAIESDAQHIKERPRCLLSNEPAPPLIVTRGVDATTARGIGLGPSIVSESAESYRSMAFTATVSGVLLSRMFNMPMSDDDMPGAGLSTDWNCDRGPGGADRLILDHAKKFPITQITPSYEGQSKPTVESSHARTVQLSGAPTYVQSNLTTVDLIKREFMYMIGQNKTRDISDRLTPQMIADGVAPNPKSLWKYLERSGRINARPWTLDDAVRTFLRPVNFTIKEDGLYLSFIRFDSEQMRETRLRNRLARSQEAVMPGYIFPLCTSIAWIETYEGLVEVSARLPLRDWKGQLYLSVFEIEQLTQKLRVLKGHQRQHAMAVWARTYREFSEETGKDWDSGNRRSGPAPKASAAAMHEAVVTSGAPKRKAS